MSEAKASGLRVLEDVVACILGVSNAKAAIAARIEKQGGRVPARLGKDVSHIVWERRHSRRPSDKAADEAELLELFHRLEKLEYPPVVVSPLWVEESIKAGRRLVERKYLVKKPTESLLGRTPGSSAAAAKKRKRPAVAALPRPAQAYELDEEHFSSTQQMHDEGVAGDGGTGAAAAPRAGTGGGPPKQQRHGGATASCRGARQQRGGVRQVGAIMPNVTELLDEDEGGWQKGEARPGRQGGAARQPPAGVSFDTQAVATILTIDLPEVEHVDGTPGGASAAADEEIDELDTPLALRFARSSAERAAAWAGDSGGRRGAPAAAPDRRSRLALASGPQGQAAAEGRPAGGAEEAEAEGMQVDEAADPEGGEEAVPPTQEGGEREEQQAQQAAEPQRALAARGVAARFSVRQLVQHPERPVLLHKGTPLPGSLPASPEQDRSGRPIPLPLVERVASPWGQAEQPSQTPGSQSQPAAAQAQPLGRPSIGQARGGRRLLGVSNVRRGSGVGGSGAGSTPSDAEKAAAAPGAAPDGKLPTPWSTLRPWDGGLAGEQSAADGGNENAAGPLQHQPTAQRAGGREPAAELVPAASAAAAAAGGPPAADGGGGAGPSRGCIALTSVDDVVVDLARSATRRLRGLRLCPQGREEGQVTHLVLGGERRTLKLMLALANGAWLLSPQWVTASLEAGRWLPESQFPAQVRFEAAAERARSVLEDPDALPLLHGRSLYVHLPDRARKLMAANAAALKRVALALGAKVVPPKACDLCLVVGGGERPPHIPRGAQCLKEEWLLLAAERFELPPAGEHLLA